jgi:RHS repeat-associated protein
VAQYCYDPNERLTSATPTSGTSYTYSYDENGNILSRASTGATTTYTAYNAANQACAQGSTAPAGCGTGFSYDADGSLTASPTQSTFGYTPAEQTSGVTPAGGSASSYTYAGTSQNELVSSGGASTATFVQGIPGITQMTTASNGTLYFERTPSGQLLSVQSGTGSSVANYDYVPDGLGSVVAMVPANTTSTTTAGGTAVAAYSYTSYGALASVTDPAGGDLTVANANPFRFTGAYQDANTKLIHLGARWYDPNTGRFTQQDGITHITDLTQGNRYAYTGDNPVNFTDPSGNSAWSDITDGVEDFMTDAGPLTKSQQRCEEKVAVTAGLGGLMAGALAGLASSETGPGAVVVGIGVGTGVAVSASIVGSINCLIG